MFGDFTQLEDSIEIEVVEKAKPAKIFCKKSGERREMRETEEKFLLKKGTVDPIFEGKSLSKLDPRSFVRTQKEEENAKPMVIAEQTHVGEEEENSEQRDGKKWFYIGSAVITICVVWIAFTGILYSENKKFIQYYYTKTTCFVNETRIIYTCKEGRHGAADCYVGYWYVIEYDFEVPKIKEGSHMSTIRAERALNKHPVGSTDVCWYDSEYNNLHWDKPNAQSWFTAFIVGLGCFAATTCCTIYCMIEKNQTIHEEKSNNKLEIEL